MPSHSSAIRVADPILASLRSARSCACITSNSDVSLQRCQCHMWNSEWRLCLLRRRSLAIQPATAVTCCHHLVHRWRRCGRAKFLRQRPAPSWQLATAVYVYDGYNSSPIRHSSRLVDLATAQSGGPVARVLGRRNKIAKKHGRVKVTKEKQEKIGRIRENNKEKKISRHLH